jgi:hypothetical protein
MINMLRAGEPDTSGYVSRLEREVENLKVDRQFLREQIKVKDGQIASLLERDRKTSIHIGKLQEMLTPLLGASRRPVHIHDTPPAPEDGAPSIARATWLLT